MRIKYFFSRIYGFFFNLFAPEKYCLYLSRGMAKYNNQAIFRGASVPAGYEPIGFHEDGWELPADFSEEGFESIKKGIEEMKGISWYLNYDIDDIHSQKESLRRETINFENNIKKEKKDV